MILIFSHEQNEKTDEVISWLLYYKVKFTRINVDISSSIIDWKIKIDLNSNKLYFNQYKVKSVWFNAFPNFSLNSESTVSRSFELADYIKSECDAFNKMFFNFCLYNCNVLGKNYQDSDLEICKLKTLILARSVGLDIPSTLIQNSFDQSKHSSLDNKIVKCLGNNIFFSIDSKRYGIYTEKVSNLNLKYNIDNYLPSILQDNILKQFELRVIIIDQLIFSAAIFSQQNKFTMQDFRKYDQIRPNRIVPYNLPKNIKSKLLKLFNLLEINTGSVDMIYSLDNRYIFLEVNPLGQYGHIAHVCNFNINQTIAKFLISNNDKIHK